MTQEQIEKAKALAKCTFPVGSGQKRMAFSMFEIATHNPEKELTLKQSNYLDLLFHQYRRQIGKLHTRLCNCEEARAAVMQIELK